MAASARSASRRHLWEPEARKRPSSGSAAHCTTSQATSTTTTPPCLLCRSSRPRVRSTLGELGGIKRMEAAGLTEAQRDTLRAFCDTIVPSIERPDDPDGFWARKATDLAIDQGVEQILTTLPPELAGGLGQLLDALAEQQFAHLSQLSREQMLWNVTMADQDAAQGVGALVGMTLFLYYGAPDP